MPLNIKKPVLRQLLVLLAFTSLVGLFFFLNFYLYIPRQQKTFNQKIFRVLEEVARDFASTLEGQIVTALKNNASQDTIGSIKQLGSDTSIHALTVNSFRRLDTTVDKSQDFTYTYQFKKDSVRIQLFHKTGRQSDSTFAIPLGKIIGPNYANLHKDLFDLLLLVKRGEVKGKDPIRLKDSLLYRIGDIPSRYAFIHDTLFKDKNYGQFSTINPITIQEQQYLAFSIPFQFRDEELILTGLLSEEEYKDEAARFSRSALIIIAALLSFVILSLPLLKIRISGRSERISVNEVRILIIVFLVAPFLVVLGLGTTLIYQYADNDSDRTLQLVENMVEENMEQEVGLALQQLNWYGRLTADKQNILDSNDKTGTIAGTEANRISMLHQQLRRTRQVDSDLRNLIYYPTHYFNLDDIFWVNNSGYQIGKWFLLDEKVSYLDVSSRNYYQKIKEGEAGSFPRTGAPFYIEPTISWATGDYSVNVVTASRQNLAGSTSAKNRNAKEDAARNQAILIGLAARLYAVYQPVIAKGYHFAIVKRDGAILFHSETERCLHENIIDETNEHPALVNAMARNDSILIPNIKMYDLDVKMRVKPWRLMPEFYLVTYFTKREQNLFVFHIAAFTLLAVSALLLALLFFHLFKSLLTNSNHNTFVRSYPSQWMRPSKARNEIYSNTLVFFAIITIIAALLLLVATAFNRLRTEAYLFQALFLLPFLITTGYFFVVQNTKLPGTERPLSFSAWLLKERKLVLFYFFFIALTSILMARLLHDCSNFHLDSFLALLLSLAVPLLGFLHYRKPQLFHLNRPDYFKNYLSLLGACILLVAIVPAIGMMYYAFRQEYVMRIKAEQLKAAKDISDRRLAINNDLKRNKVDLSLTPAGSAFIRNLKFHPSYGIYLPHQQINRQDQMQYGNGDCAHRPDQPPVYLGATRFLLLPNDHNDIFQNNAQHQWLDSSKIILQSANITDRRNTDSLLLTATHGTAPALGDVVRNPATYIWLLLTLIFIVLHLLVMRSTVKKVFLLDYLDDALPKQQGATWSDSYYKLVLGDKEEWQSFGISGRPNRSKDIQVAERFIAQKQKGKGPYYLQLQQLLKPAHELMWQQIPPEEQLVLYDFALDGFTNYRNTDLIYNLMQKGLIIRTSDGHLEVMTHSFRNYMVNKNATAEVKALEDKFKVNTSWKSLKNLLLGLLLAVTIFLFATQRDLTDKMLAIISGLVTLVPLVVKLFDRPAASNNSSGT
ncbi:hypothetical protein SAMN05444008_110191 [Cnuella takakiae]|uniref:Cache domain-containing protein n=1 Tax=Cnuella takakiae TaxID=1302690 RepID=A0A1M5DE61_9BACT|nr:cache domain-containing protein [Cnuella takakiae]OLY94001.1 hypothetical protein BUE76_20520 [Cnuella takakiae]SHF65171.1 hypothetical protein SAMN05444008_110191 [Cnuella takakiae]